MTNEDLKTDKQKRLLDSGFKLFTENGIVNTSIQNIVDQAKMAKGTFYLYFKDKYELRDVLVARKSKKLFTDAIKSLKKNYIENFEDQIIYIINYVIDELTKNQLLLAFISKNLSWGVYHETLVKIYDKNEPDKDAFNELREMFIDGLKKNNIKLKNPDVTLFMIIELVSATAFNAITYKKPLSIEEYKPHLYSTIRLMLKNEN